MMLVFTVLLTLFNLMLCAAILVMPMAQSCGSSEWGLHNCRAILIVLSVCIAMPSVLLWQIVLGLGASVAVLAMLAVLILVSPRLIQHLPQI